MPVVGAVCASPGSNVSRQKKKVRGHRLPLPLITFTLYFDVTVKNMRTYIQELTNSSAESRIFSPGSEIVISAFHLFPSSSEIVVRDLALHVKSLGFVVYINTSKYERIPA